jgi:putative endonuclease
MPGNFYTYILYSEVINKYYIGSTENLEKRLLDHNAGMSTFTKRGIPWRLVYFEVFETRKEALNREYEIKNKKSKRYIEYLINNKPQSN